MLFMMLSFFMSLPLSVMIIIISQDFLDFCQVFITNEPRYCGRVIIWINAGCGSQSCQCVQSVDGSWQFIDRCWQTAHRSWVHCPSLGPDKVREWDPGIVDNVQDGAPVRGGAGVGVHDVRI